MSEFAELDAMIVGHTAWKNQFFERAENIRLDQLRFIAPEYHYVTDGFPAVLAQLITRVDRGTQFYLANILYSELGSGIESDGHSKLFRRLCHDIGVTDDDIAQAPQLRETRDLVDGLTKLYRDAPIAASVGGQYALEFQADNMLRSFRKAFSMLENANGASEGMQFFVVHDTVEPEHVQAMRQALVRHMKQNDDMQLITQGAKRCLDLFGEFWTALGNVIANMPRQQPNEKKLTLVANRR